MISVYYNQKYGFLIVPNAIERFMGCYISIEPTIEIMAEETIEMCIRDRICGWKWSSMGIHV